MRGKERLETAVDGSSSIEIAVDESLSKEHGGQLYMNAIMIPARSNDTHLEVTYNTKISPTILRVPQSILASKPDSYKPKNISLGPFHHKALPKGYDHIKEPYRDKFIKRNPEVDREAYITEIKFLEQEARSAYQDSLTMNSNEFAEMMLLDCCFVLEFLLVEGERKKDNRQRWPKFLGRTHKSPQQQQQPEEEDPIAGSVLPLIRHEILMLENQLPLFLLQKLFEKAAGTGSTLGPIKFEDLIFNFFGKFSLFLQTFMTNNINNLIKKEPGHLLHLFLNCMRPSRYDACENCPDWLPAISCAKELSKEKVMLVKKGARSILDISFQKPRLFDVANLWSGQLEIPQLSIDDHTDTLFRNLIAFERLFPKVGNHVSAYARFMGSIMGDSKDVELLRQRNILRKQQDDEDVVKLFKQLSKEMQIDLKSSYLGKVVNDVTQHCEELRENREKWSNSFWRLLKQTYFSNPRLGNSVAAVIIFFVLTFLQTLYTILGYVKPKGK